MAGWHTVGLTHSRTQKLLDSDYRPRVSLGDVDEMLAGAGQLFAYALEAITKATRKGRKVVVNNTGGRGGEVSHFLSELIAREVRASLFVVDHSGGYRVLEAVLSGNPEQTLACAGGTGFNSLNGKKRIYREGCTSGGTRREVSWATRRSLGPDGGGRKAVEFAAAPGLKTAMPLVKASRTGRCRGRCRGGGLLGERSKESPRAS